VPPERGQSAVVVPVPDAEPLVAGWRRRLDPSAAVGMPAHITLLVPFLREERLTDEVVLWLRELCGAMPVLDVAFRRAARFPSVLYLDPEPRSELRGMALAIAARWDTPPYGGAFDEVVPHLTVADGAPDEALAVAEAAVARGLPLTTRLTEAQLMVFDGDGWGCRERLPFGP
jgi:2'-5' RNA ligase